MKDAETDIPILGLGLTWEDYGVGQKFKSLARTITEADIVNFIGVTGFAMHLFPNDSFRNLCEIVGQSGAQFLKLGPQGLVNETLRRLDNEALAVHSTVAKRSQAITT